MDFDIDDVCEGLESMLQDINDALSRRNLRKARQATEQLLSDIEDAITAEKEAEEDGEE